VGVARPTTQQLFELLDGFARSRARGSRHKDSVRSIG
jgi:hypothetical protein